MRLQKATAFHLSKNKSMSLGCAAQIGSHQDTNYNNLNLNLVLVHFPARKHLIHALAYFEILGSMDVAHSPLNSIKERRGREKGPIVSGIQTHDLWIANHVLYHCAATAARR